jgi:putative endonuclease
MKLYYVYILKCSDKSYYTGVTNDMDRRLREHEYGLSKDSYTYTKRPVELVFHYQFNDINQAIRFEKQVKGWSRKKKEAIIGDNWDELKKLAICRNNTSHLNHDE